MASSPGSTMTHVSDSEDDSKNQWSFDGGEDVDSVARLDTPIPHPKLPFTIDFDYNSSYSQTEYCNTKAVFSTATSPLRNLVLSKDTTLSSPPCTKLNTTNDEKTGFEKFSTEEPMEIDNEDFSYIQPRNFSCFNGETTNEIPSSSNNVALSMQKSGFSHLTKDKPEESSQSSPLFSPLPLYLEDPTLPEAPLAEHPPDTQINLNVRSLRRRTERQLYPFTADLALHRQQFRQLGIKPVAFHGIPEHSRSGHKSQEEFQLDDPGADGIVLPPVGEIMTKFSPKRRVKRVAEFSSSPPQINFSKRRVGRAERSPQDTCSSESETDDSLWEQQKLKKKLHGIFPGSFVFRSEEFGKSPQHKRSRTLDAVNRKGVAKKKKGKAKDFNLLNFAGDEDSEEEPEPKTLREPDIVDRMYCTLGQSRQTKLLFTSQRNAVQKPKHSTSIRRSLLGIVDVCNVYQAQAKKPPDFLRICRKTAQKRFDFGRTVPIGKRIIFEDDDDNEQVCRVIQEWKRGRIFGQRPAKRVLSEGIDINQPPKVETAEYTLRPYKRLVQSKIDKVRSKKAQLITNQPKPTSSTSRLRRKAQSSRINRDRYDEVFRDEIRMLHQRDEHVSPGQTTKQVLLTDFLVPSKSYTRSFNVVPVVKGTRFSSNTFIGSGGLSAILTGNCCFEPDVCEVFGLVLDIQESFTKLPQLASAVFRKIVDVCASPDGSSQVSSCYNFFRWLVKCNSHIMKRSSLEETETFVRSMLQTIETFLDDMICISKSLDYQMESGKLYLQASMFSSIWAYQYALTLFNLNSDSLSAQHLLVSSAKRQLLNLLQVGLEVVDDGFRKQRAHLGVFTTDSFHIELWVILLHITDGSNRTFNNTNTTSFWTLLNSNFQIFQEKDRIITYELIWYLVMNICRLYQFDEHGIALKPQGPDNWAMLERLVKVVILSCHSSETFSYLKTLIGRCHNLVYNWGWSNSKNITITLFDFYSKRKFEHIEVNGHLFFPEFLRNLDKESCLEVETSDTAFHIVLKLAALLFKHTVSGGRKGPINNLVSRLKPLSSRHYPRDCPFEDVHYISLVNHYSILILLYWLTPSYCRPTLEMIRDTVIPSQSHIKAVQVSLHAWKSISRVVLSREEDISCLSDWMTTSLDGMRTEYVQLHRAASWKDIHMGGDLAKEEKVECELKQIGKVIVLALQVFEDLLKSPTIRNEPSKAFLLPLRGIIVSLLQLTTVALFNVFTTAPDLSEDIKLASLRLLNTLISIDYKTVSTQHCTGAIEHPGVNQESQDYDGDFFDDIDVDEMFGIPSNGARLAQFINDNVIQALGQMAASCLSRNSRASEKLIRETLTLWIRSTSLLILQKLRSPSTFFGLGQESWDRLSNTPLKTKWNVFYLVEVGRQNPSIIVVSCKEQYLDAWFSEIVHPKVTTQHLLTNYILNTSPLIDAAFDNPPIARGIDEQFCITAQELSTVRSALVTHILSNIGNIVEKASTHNEQLHLIEQYRSYIGKMLQTMRIYFLDSKGTLRDRYVKFVQPLVGAVIRYLPSLKKGAVSEALEWFSDASQFPQLEELLSYAVHDFRSKASKLDLNFECQALRSRIKTILLNEIEQGGIPFSRFFVQVFQQDLKTRRDDQLSKLREFILCDVFLKFIKLSETKMNHWALPFASRVIQTITATTKLAWHRDDTISEDLVKVLEAMSGLVQSLDLGFLIGQWFYANIYDLVNASLRIWSWAGHNKGTLEQVDWYFERATRLLQKAVPSPLNPEKSPTDFTEWGEGTISNGRAEWIWEKRRRKIKLPPDTFEDKKIIGLLHGSVLEFLFQSYHINSAFSNRVKALLPEITSLQSFPAAQALLIEFGHGDWF